MPVTGFFQSENVPAPAAQAIKANPAQAPEGFPNKERRSIIGSPID